MIDKQTAIQIGSEAWTQAMAGRNSTAGFKTAGLFPLSYPQMVRRVELFNSGGAGKEASRARWLIHRPAIVSEVLTLPAQEQKDKRAKRKTVDVAGRLLTREDLLHMTAAPSKRRSIDFSVAQEVFEFV